MAEALLDGKLHALLHTVDVVVVHHQVPAHEHFYDQQARNTSPIRSKEHYVEPGSPAQILNLHPLLGDDGGVAHCCAIFHLLGQLTNGGLAQGLGGEQRPHPLCGTKDATGHRAGA